MILKISDSISFKDCCKGDIITISDNRSYMYSYDNNRHYLLSLGDYPNVGLFAPYYKKEDLFEGLKIIKLFSAKEWCLRLERK